MAKEWHGIIDEPDYSEDEDRVYNESFEILRKGLERGLSFDDACGGLKIDDARLRAAVIDDFLKITIAEDHFAKGISLDDVAGRLRVESARLEKARKEMIKEIQETSVEVHRKEVAEGLWEVPGGDEPDGPEGNA